MLPILPERIGERDEVVYVNEKKVDVEENVKTVIAGTPVGN